MSQHITSKLITIEKIKKKLIIKSENTFSHRTKGLIVRLFQMDYLVKHAVVMKLHYHEHKHFIVTKLHIALLKN